jgi:hypothetical protein
MLYGVHFAWTECVLTTLVVIGTDCIGSNKSNSIGVETKSSALVIFTFERETRQNITVNFFYFIEYTPPWAGFKLITLVVIGTDYIGGCKSNFHTITTTTTPHENWNIAKKKKKFTVIFWRVSLSNVKITSALDFVSTPIELDLLRMKIRFTTTYVISAYHY